ncbi:MAG: FCD domain-containing protein [Hyphomicrobiales bacterium]|nr:MAG: FCD domain-containing protein [Hyphomicrobiales bacterium]
MLQEAPAQAEPALTAGEQKKLSLARRLLQIARDEHWEKGHRLLENHLAEQLDVSRSPIRALLKYLAGQGVVVLEPGRGARFDLSPAQLDELHFASPPTASEKLYEAIIRARLTGQLGESFTQTEVIRNLQGSRALVDSVLQQLASDGILSRRGGRGWTFQPTLDSAKSQRESYEFRKLLEPGAIRSPLFSISPERVQALQQEHLNLIKAVQEKTADAAYIYSVDIGFHRAIACCSGNSFIEDALERQNKLRRLLEYTSYERGDRVIAWAHEHLEILAALERDRTEVAAMLMLMHIRNAQLETASPL